jgi:DNA-directed RNA polymerase specialized sigma24 family protein
MVLTAAMPRFVLSTTEIQALYRREDAAGSEFIRLVGAGLVESTSEGGVAIKYDAERFADEAHAKRAFLMRVRFAAIDVERGRKLAAPTPTPAPEPESKNADPGESVACADFIARITCRLSPPDADLLVGSVAGYTSRELAHQFGVNELVVRQRLTRARQRAQRAVASLEMR